MNPSNPLQTEEQEIGDDSYYAASAVSPNVNHQDKTSSLFTIDCFTKPVSNAAQTLEDQQFEDPESQQQYLDCITQVWHKEILLLAWRLEEYCNKTHLSAVLAAVQYFETLLQNQDDEVPDYEPSDEEDEYSRLQNPTKTPINSKDFLRARPHCPIIHWGSQMCNDPTLCVCPCSKHSSPWREYNNIFIHDDHECKVGLMTPQDLVEHLRSEDDSTHTAMSIYLETIHTFSQGHVRQDPGVNSKKKPHSEEEEKEEKKEEEEEVATASDSNDVSCEHVDMNACEHSKQGLETQIASETHNDPKSVVTDGCESSKNVPDVVSRVVLSTIISPYLSYYVYQRSSGVETRGLLRSIFLPPSTPPPPSGVAWGVLSAALCSLWLSKRPREPIVPIFYFGLVFFIFSWKFIFFYNGIGAGLQDPPSPSINSSSLMMTSKKNRCNNRLAKTTIAAACTQWHGTPRSSRGATWVVIPAVNHTAGAHRVPVMALGAMASSY
jgi:hypothetical protein